MNIPHLTWALLAIVIAVATGFEVRELLLLLYRRLTEAGRDPCRPRAGAMLLNGHSPYHDTPRSSYEQMLDACPPTQIVLSNNNQRFND